MRTSKLSPAQKRMLEEVRRDGQRVYNGRARLTIKALENAGLVIVDWDWVPSYPVWSERITVSPAEPDPAEGTYEHFNRYIADDR